MDSSGFALVAILLFLALAATIVTPFVIAARTERLIQSGLYRAKQLDLFADGLSNLVAQQLTAGPAEHVAIPLNAEPVSCKSDALTVVLTVQDHAGLVNLNAAPPPLIAAGLEAIGKDAKESADIAAVVEQYRLPQVRGGDTPAGRAVRGGLKGGPFESAVELSDIEGLDEYSQRELNRFFTVHARTGVIVADRAPRELAARLSGLENVAVGKSSPDVPLSAMTIDVAVADGTGMVGRSDLIVQATPGAWPGFRRVEQIVPSEDVAMPRMATTSCDVLFGADVAALLADAS